MTVVRRGGDPQLDSSPKQVSLPGLSDRRRGSGKDEDDALHGRRVLRASRSGLYTLDLRVPRRVRIAKVGIDARFVEGVGRNAVSGDDELERDGYSRVGQDGMGV